VEDKDHPRNAVLAALEMLRECDMLNKKFTARGWPTLKIGIGVNSETSGSGIWDRRSAGRTPQWEIAVNVASRLEGRTKLLRRGILVGEATRTLVKDVVFKEIDKIKVKGKDEAITIYERWDLRRRSKKRVLDELKLWHQTMRLYRSRQWDQVEVNFAQSSSYESGMRSVTSCTRRKRQGSAEPPRRPNGTAWTVSTRNSGRIPSMKCESWGARRIGGRTCAPSSMLLRQRCPHRRRTESAGGLGASLPLPSRTARTERIPDSYDEI